MFEIKELTVEEVVVLFLLAVLEVFGLQLGDQDVLLVLFQLGLVVILRVRKRGYLALRVHL